MTDIPIRMFRTRTGGLAPLDQIDRERIEALAWGQPIDVTVKQKRTLPPHRHFFATLHTIVQSGATPFPTVDALLDALKVSLGVCELRKSLDGRTFYVPGSISFAAKDQAAFLKFREDCFRLLSEHYGIPADVFDPRIRSAA